MKYFLCNLSNNKNIKAQQVESMFDGIAHRYDFLNHTLSFGVDKIWRKRLINGLLKKNPATVLDIATGTGDLAIALAKKDKIVKITGADVSEKMLAVAKEKIAKKKLSERIELTKTSSEELPFPDSSFNAAMVAFGVRNFYNPQQGLSQICRVLKPKGTIHVLEFTMPKSWPVKNIYRFYFHRILPLIGKKVSGHSDAYTYLPESVEAFAEREDFIELLKKSGFTNARYTLQSFGIAAIYTAEKD